MDNRTLNKEELKARISAKFPGHTIVCAEKDSDFLAYVVHENEKQHIGSGSYGDVFVAHAIDLKTLEIDKSKKLVAKKLKDISQFNLSEVDLFKRYYGTSELGQGDTSLYQIMDYLPGDALYQFDKNKSPILSSEIEKLNFPQRITLIQNIMMFINVMHNNTPSTGAPLAHSDLNGVNIHAHITRNDSGVYKYDVYLLDFGIANEVEVDVNETQDDKRALEGAPAYMPLEVFNERRGIKSDVYALSAIFIILLGGVNPFKYKNKFTLIKDEFYSTGFCFDGILTGYDVPVYDPDVACYLMLILSKMQSNDYNERPDTNQILRFFTTLDIHFKSYDPNVEDDDLFVRTAILALIASGLWEIEFVGSDNEKFIFSFDKFNLYDHIEFCIDIVLNSQLSQLLHSSPFGFKECEISRATLDGLLQKHRILIEKTEPDVIPVKRRIENQDTVDVDAINKMNAEKYGSQMPLSLSSLFSSPPQGSPAAESEEAIISLGSSPASSRFS